MGKKIQTANSSAFKVGAISLAFLVIGYQTAIFVHKVSVERSASLRDHPDTVYVVDSTLAAAVLGAGHRTSVPARRDDGAYLVRREARHEEPVKEIREKTKKAESFRFDPNTAGIEDLKRLGFSEKQATSIDNYRKKGGRFRRASDFAKSFVVSEDIFKRLEPYIDIPLLDINKADSAAFDTLPGIGGWFASRMVSYRNELGGYSHKEQLMEIYHFDREKYEALADLISCSAPKDSLGLWELPADSLRKHPHIRNWATAKAIVMFRENTDRKYWTVQALEDAGILDRGSSERLKLCAIRPPVISSGDVPGPKPAR